MKLLDGHDQQVGEQRLPRADDVVADDAADHGGEPGDGVEEQRPGAREAGVEQDDVVADLLRDLVGDDRQRGHDAQAGVGEEGGGDDDAVAEVVDAVAEDHAPAAAARPAAGRSRGGGGARRPRGGGCGGRARPSRAGRRTAVRAAASANRLCGLALLSKASGSTSSSAVPSSTPAERLTRWWTTRVSTPTVRLAATPTDSSPPSNVAATM